MIALSEGGCSTRLLDPPVGATPLLLPVLLFPLLLPVALSSSACMRRLCSSYSPAIMVSMHVRTCTMEAVRSVPIP